MARRTDRPDTKGQQVAAALWEKALELYRTAGHHDESRQLETSLIALYKRLYARVPEAETEPESDAGTTFSRWDVFLKIGCIGFGGPMAVFALLKEELVQSQKILTEKDFLDGAVLGDVLPGPVTMDIVTYTGYKIRKWWGALSSTVLFILPSFVLMVILAMLYDSYRLAPRVGDIFACLAAAVTGVIVSVAIKLTKREVRDYPGLCIMVCAFALELVLKLDIVVVVGLAGLVGVFLYRDDPEEELSAS